MTLPQSRHLLIFKCCAIAAVVVALGFVVAPFGFPPPHPQPPQTVDDFAQPSSATLPSASAATSQTTPSATRPTTAQPERTDPLANIDSVIRDFQKGMEQSEDMRLIQFDLELKQSLKSGWKPPWSDLAPRLTDEQIRTMSTEDLGKACLASGLPARSMLIYDNPHFGIRRLEILHKGYTELFRRPDSWKAFAAVADLCSSQLDPNGPTNDNVNAVMVLTSLPYFYGYPAIRKQLAGHEREIISAHLQTLKKISAYLDAPPDKGQPANSAPFFSATAPTSLITSALALGKALSPEKYQAARLALSRHQWAKDYSARDVKQYVDHATSELQRFLE